MPAQLERKDNRATAGGAGDDRARDLIAVDPRREQGVSALPTSQSPKHKQKCERSAADGEKQPAVLFGSEQRVGLGAHGLIVQLRKGRLRFDLAAGEIFPRLGARGSSLDQLAPRQPPDEQKKIQQQVFDAEYSSSE